VSLWNAGLVIERRFAEDVLWDRDANKWRMRYEALADLCTSAQKFSDYRLERTLGATSHRVSY
jgi:hypothetical protein